MRRLIFVILFLPLLLASCVNLNIPQTSSSATFTKQAWRMRYAQLKKINSWQIAGAFSFQGQQQKPVIASYTWRQRGLQYQLSINSSLDLYTAKIIGTKNHVTLWRSNKSYSANNPETLMQEQLGWRLPLDKLFYWLRGIPAPGKYRTTKFDRYGHLIQFAQQGWLVRLGHFTSSSSVDLPQLLQLSNPSYKARIVIKDWVYIH